MAEEYTEGQETEDEGVFVPKPGIQVVGMDESETQTDQLERAAGKIKQEDQNGEVEFPITSPPVGKRYPTDVYVVWKKTDGEIVAIWAIQPPEKLVGEFFKIHKITFWWTKPDYQTQSLYREKCQVYQPNVLAALTDIRRLHRIYWDSHLKQVDGLYDREGKPIRLELAKDGTLTPESYEKIMESDTAIADQAMFLYQRDVLMVNV